MSSIPGVSPASTPTPQAIFPVPEFQAILLAGYGNRLYPLTDSSSLPKALLPVVNKPMLYYQLKWLEDAKINDILIAVYPSAQQYITDYIQKMYEESPETRIQIVPVPDGSGTADALRCLKSYVKTDFLVMSCDLITNIPPHFVINAFRLQSPTMVSFLYDYGNVEAMAEKPPAKDDDLKEIIAMDDTTSRLLFSTTKGDLSGTLKLKAPLLRQYPRLHLHSQLRDSHLYIFQKWVLDYISKNKHISSIKTDLIPILIESQYRPSLMKREGIDKYILGSHGNDLAQAIALSTTGKRFDQNGVVCTGIVYSHGFTSRCNTLWSFMETNRALLKSFEGARVGANTEISPRTQVGQDSVIGESCSIDERSSIKKSVLGNHVKIGKNVKISSSILMDYVEIGDNAKIDGCILCPGSRVGTKSSLKDCEVGVSYNVTAERSCACKRHVIQTEDCTLSAKALWTQSVYQVISNGTLTTYGGHAPHPKHLDKRILPLLAAGFASGVAGAQAGKAIQWFREKQYRKKHPNEPIGECLNAPVICPLCPRPK